MSARRSKNLDKRLFATLMFLARLLALSLPLYVVPLYPALLLPLQDAVAGSSHGALLFFGFSAERDGLFITITSGEPFGLFIGPDCTGWKSAVLFIALLIAPAGIAWRKRALGAAIGLPALYAANIARIATVASAGAGISEGIALLLHDFLWQWGLTIAVLSLWACFLMWSGALGKSPWKNKHIPARIKNKLCA
jgi:exosortase/archaeosortase family protein